MKIAFIAPFGLGQKTTVWARTLPLAKELVKLGHEVKILIPPWDTPADSDKCWNDGGVELINVSLSGGLPFTIFRLLHEVWKFQPQIVHIVKPRAHAGIVQWLLWYFGFWILKPEAKNTKASIHLDLDDWEQAWAEINHYPWLVAKFLAWQEEWGIRHSNGITTASRWLETKANAYAPGMAVLYLPNGVVGMDGEMGRWGDEGKGRKGGAQLAIRNSQSAILYLTRYVEVEVEWLARLSASLHAISPTARLIIAGEPLQAGRDQLFRAALTAPVESSDKSSVSFLGKVTPAQIEELYASVDCAIFPSQVSILQQAKCSVRLATTLLHGVPVIASAVGEQANYGAAGAARLVAADATPEEFAQAVIEVLRDPEAQQHMIEQARTQLGKRYQWQQLGQRLDSWYRGLPNSQQ